MSKLLLLLSISLLIACTTQEKIEVPIDIVDGRPDKVSVDFAMIPDAVPQYEPWSKSVNPKKYTVLGKEYQVLSTNKGYMKQGIASWYGTKFHQHKTATGEDYDMFAMTAAHKTLPIPSYVRVTNLDNHQTVIVRINDRGPFHEHRIIDLSYAAAVKLGLEKDGTGFVEVVALPTDELGSTASSAQARPVFLQIGAFSDQINAINLQQRFADLRLTTSRIVSAKIREQNVYKVQVGPIASVSEADEIIEKIKKLGIYKSHFISD